MSTGMTAPVVEPVQEVPSMPTIEPIMPQMNVMSTGMTAPVVEPMQEVPSMPTIEPIMPQMNVMPTEMAAPVVEPVQEVPSMPTIEPIMPQMNVMPTEMAAPVVEPVQEAPSMPTIEPIITLNNDFNTVPQTSPIIDSSMLNNTPITEESQEISTPIINTQEQIIETKNDFVAPKPIIITDYSKQYDPIMPAAMEEPVKMDFKEVISAIRECSAKIEKYGYKLDVEEYDLSTLYQVIFKIEK